MIDSRNLVCVSPCPPNVSIFNSVAVLCTGFNQIEQYEKSLFETVQQYLISTRTNIQAVLK
jgi:hypothetical protein